MKQRPLSEEEVEQAIKKIRQMYDDYIIAYTKPFTLKKAFDDRYLQALRSRIDLTRFIQAEFEVVRQLAKTEEEKLLEAEEKRFKQRTKPVRALGIADRVLNQHRKQIEKYPELELDPRTAYEIRKLFGALDVLEKEYWPPFEALLRKIYPSYYANPRIELEPRIYALCPGAGDSPPIISRYDALLLRLPRSINDVEWEEKRLLTESAFLLHQLTDVIAKLPIDELDASQREIVEKMSEYVHNLLSDFRLKDLKPAKLGG